MPIYFMLFAGGFTVNRRKIALVTGASAGIGAAVSVALAKADYQVIGVARRLDKVRRLNEQLNDAATRIDARCVDIRREADIESLFAYIRDEYGTLDVLVNNAGLGRDASLLDGETDAWRHMFELNVIALSVCTREAVKLMEHGQRAGHVVHIVHVWSSCATQRWHVLRPTPYVRLRRRCEGCAQNRVRSEYHHIARFRRDGVCRGDEWQSRGGTGRIQSFRMSATKGHRGQRALLWSASACSNT